MVTEVKGLAEDEALGTRKWKIVEAFRGFFKRLFLFEIKYEYLGLAEKAVCFISSMTCKLRRRLSSSLLLTDFRAHDLRFAACQTATAIQKLKKKQTRKESSPGSSL